MMSGLVTRRPTGAKSLTTSYESFDRTNGFVVKLGAISSTV